MPRLRTIILPILLIVLLVGGWTAVWNWGSVRAEEVIERWLTSEAANGRVITCGERRNGGYPFRMEITCLKPVIELRDEARPYQTYRFERLHVTSQIWSPGHVIAEATGPMTMSSEANAMVVTGNWRLAQASAKLNIGGYDNSSVVFDDLVVTRDGAPLLKAVRGEFHTKPNQADPLSVDVVSKLTGAVFATQASPPVDTEVQLIARKLLRTASRPQPLSPRLWQAAGGSIDLILLRIAQGDALGLAKGTLRLTSDGRPDGQVELRVANIESAIEASGLRASLGPIALGAVTMASRPTDVEGRPGRLLTLRASEGRLQIGPLRLGLPVILP
jgi:hypothetical protein